MNLISIKQIRLIQSMSNKIVTCVYSIRVEHRNIRIIKNNNNKFKVVSDLHAHTHTQQQGENSILSDAVAKSFEIKAHLLIINK